MRYNIARLHLNYWPQIENLGWSICMFKCCYLGWTHRWDKVTECSIVKANLRINYSKIYRFCWPFPETLDLFKKVKNKRFWIQQSWFSIFVLFRLNLIEWSKQFSSLYFFPNLWVTPKFSTLWFRINPWSSNNLHLAVHQVIWLGYQQCF